MTSCRSPKNTFRNIRYTLVLVWFLYEAKKTIASSLRYLVAALEYLLCPPQNDALRPNRRQFGLHLQVSLSFLAQVGPWEETKNKRKK